MGGGGGGGGTLKAGCPVVNLQPTLKSLVRDNGFEVVSGAARCFVLGGGRQCEGRQRQGVFCLCNQASCSETGLPHVCN